MLRYGIDDIRKLEAARWLEWVHTRRATYTCL
jgi:hypothetical protein